MKEAYYPEMDAEFAAVLKSLKGKKVMVLGHVRPDGDCIGSQVALCRVLNAIGADAFCLNADNVPNSLESFVGDTPFQHADTAPEGDIVAVSVDCADKVRMGKSLAESIPVIELNVDHHVSNTRYGTHNFIHDGSSATAEILAGFFLDNDYPIDAVTAQALYIGIATDTGQFRFGTTSQQVFEICCELLRKGADPAGAAMEYYERESKAKMALLQRFLASFRYECDGKVCIGLLPNGIYDELGAVKDDSEGLVDYARSIDGVEIGVLVEERDGAIKGSFRAKEPHHQVHLLAKEFNGGGHACAAGFNTEGTLDDFMTRLVTRLHEHFADQEAAVAAR